MMDIFVPEFHGIGEDHLCMKKFNAHPLQTVSKSTTAVHFSKDCVRLFGKCATPNGTFTASLSNGVNGDDETEFTFSPALTTTKSQLQFSLFPNPPHLGARIEFSDIFQNGLKYRIIGATSRKKDPTITGSLEEFNYTLPYGINISGSVHYGDKLDFLYEIVSKYATIRCTGLGPAKSLKACVGVPACIAYINKTEEMATGGVKLTYGPVMAGIIGNMKKQFAVRTNVALPRKCEIGIQVDNERRVVVGAKVSHRSFDVHLTESVCDYEHQVRLCWNESLECVIQARKFEVTNLGVNWVSRDE